MDWVGLIGGIAGLIAAVVSVAEWRRVRRKIAMVTDFSKAAEIVPAWYTSRMMTDDWLFGLTTNDGRVVAITRIKAVSDDGHWLDVELADPEDVKRCPDRLGPVVGAVAADRRCASIRIASIVAALDLQSS